MKKRTAVLDSLELLPLVLRKRSLVFSAAFPVSVCPEPVLVKCAGASRACLGKTVDKTRTKRGPFPHRRQLAHVNHALNLQVPEIKSSKNARRNFQKLNERCPAAPVKFQQLKPD
jgi:hypothetical protein